MPSDRPFYFNRFLHHILSSTCLHSTTDIARYVYDNDMIMGLRMFSTLTRSPFCRLIYLFINLSFPISNSAIHPACWLPRLQSLLVTLNFKWLQFSPWWHGEVAGSTSERVVLDRLPAAGVLLERREVGEERSGASRQYWCILSFLWLFWRLLSHLGMCGMADCSIFAAGWVADGGAALLCKAASR